MNYSVVPLNGGNQFDLNGVRFNGKSFMFWKKKGNQPITEIVVVFDRKNENIQVRDGVAILSLKGLTSYSDIKEAIQIFINIIQNDKIQFHFIVENENEKRVADALGSELGISYVVQNLNQNVQYDMQTMENDIRNQNLSAGSSQVVEKYDNGALKKISVDMNRNVAYENEGTLSNEEEKVALLREWMQDPVRAQELVRMSVEARNELLNQAVMGNRREYHMESASQVVADDKAGKMAQANASYEDGLVNTELNIGRNNVSNPEQFSVFERDGDNVRKVNPNVISSNLSSYGVTSVGASADNMSQYEDYYVNIQNEEMQDQQRNIEQVFYIDNDNNILDENGNLMGRVGESSQYVPDFENNTILSPIGGEMKVVGYIENYHDKNLSGSREKSNPKSLVRKKNNREKSAAFVSLPVIMFVLSALLLIVSAVLLFIVD